MRSASWKCRIAAEDRAPDAGPSLTSAFTSGVATEQKPRVSRVPGSMAVYARSMPSSLWQSLADLRVGIDGYSVERRELVVSPEFTRVTTTVVLHGDGETGRGEDVTYTAADHDGFPADEMLAGTWTLGEYA